jgi:hypothetical protein
VIALFLIHLLYQIRNMNQYKILSEIILDLYFKIAHLRQEMILSGKSIRVRSPAGAEDFSSSLCVQTSSGDHPASCTMGTGGPFPGGKARPGRDDDHSPLSSAEVVNEELYLLSPQAPPWRVEGLLFTLLLLFAYKWKL